MKGKKVKPQTGKTNIPYKKAENQRIKHRIIPDSIFDKIINKYSFWIAFGLILIIGLFAFSDYLFINKLYFFKDIGSDTINVDYPSMMLSQNMAKGSTFYTWSFNLGMGAPFFSGILNPFNIDLYVGTPLMSILKIFYGADPALYRFPLIFLSMLIIGVFCYFYLRTIGINKFATVIGTIVFSFIGFTVMGSSWGHHGDVFWGIALLFAFEQFFKFKRWYFIPLVMMMFNGNVFYIYLYGLFLAIYFVFRYIDEREWNTKEFLILSLQIAGLALLGVGMNLVNSLTDMLTIINSPRVSGHSTYFDILASNTSPAGQFLEKATVILRTFSTDLMGNGSNFKGWYNYLEAPAFYCGLSTLIIFPQIFIHLPKKQKILYGVLFGFWLLIAFVPYLRYSMLLFSGDYYKRGIDLFIPLFLIFFAVKALSYIDKNTKINVYLLVGTLIFYFILLYFPYVQNINEVIKNNIRLSVTLFLILYTVLVYLISIPNLRAIIRVFLILIIVIEAIMFSSTTVNKRDAYSKDEFVTQAGGFNDNCIDALKYIKSIDKTPFYRLEKDFSSGTGMHGSLNDAQAQNYFGTTSYSSFNQEFYIYFLEETGIINLGDEAKTRWAPGLRTRPLLQTMANIKYNLSKSEKPFLLNAGYSAVGKFDKVTLLKNNYYVPFGFGYKQFMKLSQFKKLTNDLQKDLALLRAFVVEDNDVAVLQNSMKEITAVDSIVNFGFPKYQQFVNDLRKDTLKISAFKQNKFEGTIKLDSARMMFLSIPYDKGWTAVVNGKEAKLERINIGFMGLFLPKGDYKIEIKYLPRYFQLSLIFSIIFTAIYILLFFFFSKYKFIEKLLIIGIILITYALYFYLSHSLYTAWIFLVIISILVYKYVFNKQNLKTNES